MQPFQVFIDGGYFLHFCVYSTIGKWTPPDTDLHEDLDPTIYPDFNELLEERATSLLEYLFNKVIPSKLEIDDSPTIYPTIFSLECKGKNNWRTGLYPQYKATRKTAKRVCNIGAAYSRLQKLILETPQFIEKFNLLPVGNPSAEGDDIIATLYPHIEANKKLLVAIDRDFLQLENLNMIDLFGNEKRVHESFKLNERGYNLTPSQYKLLKVLIGDPSDNLSAVFPGDGLIRCLKKYVTNIDNLKKSLSENASSAEQFKRNIELIDFAKIPSKISNEIILEYSTKKEKITNYADFKRHTESDDPLETLHSYSLL